MFAAPPPDKLARLSHARFSAPFFPFFSALIFALLFALLPVVVYAGDITVDGSTCTLPDAIAAANTNVTVGGCSISGTPGTETLVLTATTYSLAFNASYNVDGSNATPSITSNVVISSNLASGSVVQRSGGSNARLFHVASTGNLTLRGITVQNGKLGATAANADYGAGIFNRGTVTLIDSKLLANASHRGAGLYNTGTAALTNVEVYNNVASQHGGGLYNNNAGKTLTMTNTQVISNSAVSNGGGIYNNTTGSTVTLTNTQVLSNSAVNGAGILNSTDSFVVATNSEIRANRASGSGGGLQNNGGTTTLLTVDAYSNRASADGGGLYNSTTGTLLITHSEVISNQATAGNGGGIFNGKTVRVIDSEVRGNTANSDGGGLHNTSGTSTITNTLFYGNAASNGGAISSNINGTKVLLADSELILNTASSKGGALYINTTGSMAAITSTQILSNSSSGDGGGIYVNVSSSLTITDTQIRNNRANASGGGIFGNTTTTIRLTNSALVSNSAINQDGGGVHSDHALTVANTDFISNTTRDEGGGIYMGYLNVLTVTDSDFMGNRARTGGGIFNGRKATITNSDFLSNTATTGSGGAIYSAFVDTLTLTNSDVVGNRANGDGGGIRADNTATLTNVNLRYNRAGGRGGGLFTPYAGGFSITGEVVANTAGEHGGGIFSQATDPLTISGTLFISNTALGGSGGGLYAFLSVNLTNSPIRNNQASGNGGGVFSEFNSVTLNNSDVISNAAGLDGGGIYSFYGTTLNNSDLISNTAGNDGGGIYGTTGVSIADASVYSNIAVGGDGGAFFSQSSASVTNSSLSLNRAGGIGGAFYAFSTATVNNSDVIANEADADGGGIYANNSVELNNSDLISNTAGGSGGGLYSDLAAILTNSNVTGNHAEGRGGGVYNSGNNTLGVANSDFTDNSAVGDGGGLFINVSSTAALADSDFLTNTTSARGGGIFANTGSSVGIVNSEIRANHAITNGGGLFSNSSVTMGNVQIYANTSAGQGGGFYNNNLADLTNVEVISNTAVISGGGIYNTINSTIHLTVAELSGNHSDGDGGGFFTSNTATFSNTQILSNTASGNGGGLYNSSGIITATSSNLIGNQAGLAGGGLYQSAGQSTLTLAKILANVAGDSGGAALQRGGTTTIDQSCIVDNYDIAVDLIGGNTVDAANNWWGSADGPGGVALGAGDSVTNSVTFAPFASSALLGCPTHTTDYSFAKSVDPADDLLPGQPLTYTLVITNHAPVGVHNLRLVDVAPEEFVFREAASSGVALIPEAGGYRISTLPGSEVATLYLRGVVTGTLSADTLITNTATISNFLSSLQTAVAGFKVTVPRLSWSQAAYSTAEESGIFSTTVTISPTNPYTITTAQAYVPSPTVANLSFAPGSSSQPVGVTIPNDALVFTRTIPLRLFAAIGAMLDPAGDEASIFTVEDDDAPAITVDKRAHVTEAWLGDTITYTYRITNTGNVTLTTITASDDLLGAVAGLAGQLIPGATRSTTLSYTVQGADWPGPLVNSVTVTATDIFATQVNDNDSASVTLTTPNVSISKHTNPAGNLLPGQPLTYTITITNHDGRTIPNLYLTDTLPSGFSLSNVITSGAAFALSGGNYVIAQLPAAQVATLSFVGAVDDSLTDDVVLHNTATLTQALTGILTATVSNNVVLPQITWSTATYGAVEDESPFTATLNLSPANPYATVTVGVVITDSSPVTQLVTFPASSSSQPVVVNFTNDGLLITRKIYLQAESPLNANVGGGASGPYAQIALLESDGAPAITVAKAVNTTQAWVGETITYTYRITNTGNVTFTTLVAYDDHLGTVAELAGQLNPGASRTATRSHVVQPDDLPGPIINTVTVTATDIFSTEINNATSASVTVIEPLPAITVAKVANVSDVWPHETIIYTYRITNTGNITLSTVQAVDDKLNTIADLAGQLSPGASRSATLSYVAQLGDLPGPLVNTVVVTVTDIFANQAVESANASVNLIAPAPALAVNKSANRLVAFVGDTITYTYRITNTGNVTLTTVVAHDDKLGTVADLAGQLSPGASRTATESYVMQESDLPGPVVNTVTVTGTDTYGNQASEQSSVSVVFDTPSVDFAKYVDSQDDLLPGQPLIYTLVVTNEDDRPIQALFVTDELPAGFVLGEVNTTGAAISFNGTSYVIEELPASSVATIEFSGAVDATFVEDTALDNTAILTNTLIGQLSASVHNNVVVPTVSWSDDTYETDESSGTFTATLLMSPANPYASVSVNVIITESNASAFQAAAVQVITFPPNSTSQPVVVSFANDGEVVARTITLQLQTLSGGKLSGSAGGSFAAIDIIEENAAPALELMASVNTAQAFVGDTITYTYRITNTGNITFTTISAVDEQIGSVASLAGQLAPGDTRTAVQSYTVQASDLPGPLVNTVTVTGTDVLNTNTSRSAVTTVTISDPTALPETDQPQQPQLQLYLPSLEAVKE